MIRNAARIWGYKEPQSESSFDPLVSLLLGACAFELEKISREINNTESRIIERLVSILTPQPITSPHPAYAIGFARPISKEARVFPENQFYTEVQFSEPTESKNEDRQIYFSPTGTFKLTDGSVKYIAALNRIYEIVDDQYKDILTDKLKPQLPSSCLYIGLELKERPTEITAYFNMISEHLKQSFFSELESCILKIGKTEIKTNMGIPDLEQRDDDVFHTIKRELELSAKISRHVNKYFERQFVTIKLKDIDDSVLEAGRSIPELIKGAMGDDELENIDKEVLWLEMQFANPITDEILENLICSLNCFPVINMKKNEYTGSTRELINIIPLHTEDVFFDLKSVTNSKGETYRVKHFETQANPTKGTALLRHEGVGRFDARTAMEFLDYMLELLKEESAAFNVIGSDMISSNLRELNQSIARLEKKIEDVQLEKGDTAYLLLKPQDGDRQVFVEFWSTNCSYGNNIRTGTELNVYQAEDIDYNSTRLMTTSIGGKEKPSTEERINTYRRSLQSGTRVVTREDIKALCYEHFSDSVARIRIEKGIEKGTSKLQGFIRTIDIYLYMKEGLGMGEPEQNIIRHKLQVLLEEHSSNAYPFRIFFR